MSENVLSWSEIEEMSYEEFYSIVYAYSKYTKDMNKAISKALK